MTAGAGVGPRSGVAVLASAAILVTGCGDGPGGDRRDVADAFGDLRHAYVAGDYERVCALMSRRARIELGQLGHREPTTCPADLDRNLSAAVLSRRDRIRPWIRSIAVDGDRATVVADLAGPSPSVVRFLREESAWKLAQLFGTTAPPPPDLR